MMMLNDLFSFIRRNSKKWTIEQTKKVLNEITQIQHFLERKLKEQGEAA